jgi:hypothetical protein
MAINERRIYTANSTVHHCYFPTALYTKLRATNAMVIQLPSTPAGWLFAGLALLDIPIQSCQIINPKDNVRNFEVSPILGKALGTSIYS